MGRRCIRGIISIEILAGIESELRKSSENPKLILADYFDYVADTSTGAMMAILVALGYSVDQLRDFYLRSGAEMFHRTAPMGALSHEIRRRQALEDSGDVI